MIKKNIVILGNSKLAFEIADQIIRSGNLNLLGFIKEDKEDLPGEYSKYDLQSNSKVLLKLNADICLSIDYHRLIPAEILSKVRIINSHGGILPENRGYHASGWGFINGDRELGYSLHLMDEGVDSGAVIYRFKYRLKSDTTFNEIKYAIYEDQKRNYLKIIIKYLAGKIKPEKQKIKYPKYFSKRNISDCYIDWSRSSAFINNFIRGLSLPSGPGAYTVYKGKKLIILNSDFYKCNDYEEIPGHVVFRSGDRILVKTGNKCLWIEDVMYEDKMIKAGNLIKQTGYRLGINYTEEILKLKKII